MVPVCAKGKLVSTFSGYRKGRGFVWTDRKVLNPDWGQRGGFGNIDGHELDNLINAEWLEKFSGPSHARPRAGRIS